MKFVILSLALAALARAQNSTLIPTNITSSCSSFLSSLNSNTDLQNCVSPLINTTSSFSPTSTSTSNISESDVNYTLAALCKGNNGCSDSMVRGWLANFYSSCQAELTSTSYNSQVRELYDILYVLQPLRAAVCSIDSGNQDYCINQIRSTTNSSSSSSSSASGSATASASGSTSASAASASASAGIVNLAAVSNWDPVKVASGNLYVLISSPLSSLRKRFNAMVTRDAAQSVNMATIIAPNMTTYHNTNLAFLFLQPSMSSTQLCTPCTREILVSYVKWEVTQPYALGLSSSDILGGQTDLWTAINKTCGSSFTSAITAQVGITATGSNATGAAFARYDSAGVTGLVGISFLAGVVALFL